MKRTLIVTVAGMATRFNKDTERETLKCLFHRGEPRHCLLAQLMRMATGCDAFVIVGGYLHEELTAFTEMHLAEFLGRTRLVYNPKYSEYGSGYSLIKGIEAIGDDTDEVVFVEGDLYVDKKSLREVIQSSKDVVTTNSEPIRADKAVAFYETAAGHLRYLYDTGHSLLSVPEPFRAIHNSGQIWKFCDIPKLRRVVAELSEKQLRGTNLEIVQGYFGTLNMSDIEMVGMREWHNCNTVADYDTANKIMTRLEG